MTNPVTNAAPNNAPNVDMDLTSSPAPKGRRSTPSTGLRSGALLVGIVLAALAIMATALDAVRSGVLQLGQSTVSDAIPASFYGPAILPELLVQNVGVVIAVGVLTIIGAGWALARSDRS